MQLVTWHNSHNLPSILKEGFKPSFREVEKTWPIPHKGEWVHFYGEACYHPSVGAAKAYGCKTWDKPGGFAVGIVIHHSEYITFSNGDSLLSPLGHTSDPAIALEWARNLRHNRVSYVEFQSWAPLEKVMYFFVEKAVILHRPRSEWEYLLDYAPVVYQDLNDNMQFVDVVIK